MTWNTAPPCCSAVGRAAPAAPLTAKVRPLRASVILVEPHSRLEIVPIGLTARFELREFALDLTRDQEVIQPIR